MRDGDERRWLARAACAVLAAGAVAGTGSVALADLGPEPAVPASAHVRHPGTVRKAGHRHLRARTVVRCQSDGTDQIEDFDDEGLEPRHIVGETTPTGRCADVLGALGIAGVLPREHRTRPVR